MNLRPISFLAACALPLSAQAPAKPAPAAGPAKVAIIAFQGAVLATQEGQQAQAAMKSKFDPRKTQLEKRQADLQAMQQKLKQGATLTADARAKIENDLASGTRSLNNDAEDLNNEVQEEENKVLQAMAGKMGELIRSYATQNGYSVVLDVSSQQTPVLWAAPSVNITEEIVKLYDQKHPAKAGAPAAASPNAPAAATPPAPKPAAPKPPASKKQ